MWECFVRVRSRKLLIFWTRLHEYAKEMGKQLDRSEFRASNGWLEVSKRDIKFYLTSTACVQSDWRNMSECKFYTAILLSTRNTLSLISLILQVLTWYLLLFMYKLRFLVTIQTKVLYISCLCFLPEDGPERAETCRR